MGLAARSKNPCGEDAALSMDVPEKCILKTVGSSEKEPGIEEP